MVAIANLDFVQERNVSVVFKTIMENVSISRIQIVRECNLAAGSVTRIIRRLIDAGLVKEVERQVSGRGRRATSLAPVPEKIQILAIRAGRSDLHIGLCDLSGRLLARHSEPYHPENQQEFSKLLIRTIKTFVDQNAEHISCLAGVGVTTPGLVNSTSGIITFMPHLAVDNLPLARQVTEATGLPCYLSNFISSMALAEHIYGASRGVKNNMLVTVHNGVGAGMVLGGKLYESSSLAVGEIGHIQTDPLGKQCYCGNFGCLETLVSNSAIEGRCREMLSVGVESSLSADASIDAICQAAIAGDQLACRLLRDTSIHLGKVIAMSVNLLRPDAVVLSGDMFKAWDVVYPVIMHVLQSQTVTLNGNPMTRVIQGQLYDSPWYGGFSLVRRALLEQGGLWRLVKES